MCGRAAQSMATAFAAASSLGSRMPSCAEDSGNDEDGGAGDGALLDNHKRTTQNMSPGHTFFVFHHPSAKDGTGGAASDVVDIECTRRVWGLITQRGTRRNPLPEGPGKHFAGLMFNARSETAVEKPSFGRLIAEKKSCVLALDGFFEWKSPAKGVPKIEAGEGKQPYFVHRRDGCPLLVAGLYTSVPTGRSKDGDVCVCKENEEVLRTFTVFTTDARPSILWLHSRMPVLLHTYDDARRWIVDPSPALLKELSATASSDKFSEFLTWYPVTRRIGSTSYRGDDCMAPVVLDKASKSLKFFFSNGDKQTVNSERKCARENSERNCERKSEMEHAQHDGNESASFPDANKRNIARNGDERDPKKRLIGNLQSSAVAKKMICQSSIATPRSNFCKKKIALPPARKGTITSFFSPKN